MGGTSEEKINGLRLHINSGLVHVHDDAKGLKFSCDQTTFKLEIESAMQTLKSSDGIVKITGTGATLCIMKDNKSYDMFLAGASIKTKLNDFIRKC